MKTTNKRAFYDYEILERFEAGINLNGAEVKAVKLGRADLTRSFVKIIGSEAYLINARISPPNFARSEGYDEKRTRKLLLHKKEIIALKSKTQGQNLSIVALAFYTNNHLIKVQLGLAKGKKQFDKKEATKRKDILRDEEQEFTI